MFSEKEYDILIIELYYLKKISDNVLYVVICFNRDKFTLVLGLLRVPELPLPFPSAGRGSIIWVVTIVVSEQLVQLPLLIRVLSVK